MSSKGRNDDDSLKEQERRSRVSVVQGIAQQEQERISLIADASSWVVEPAPIVVELGHPVVNTTIATTAILETQSEVQSPCAPKVATATIAAESSSQSLSPLSSVDYQTIIPIDNNKQAAKFQPLPPPPQQQNDTKKNEENIQAKEKQIMRAAVYQNVGHTGNHDACLVQEPGNEFESDNAVHGHGSVAQFGSMSLDDSKMESCLPVPYWQAQKAKDFQGFSSASSPSPQQKQSLPVPLPTREAVSSPASNEKDKEKQMRAVIYQNIGHVRHSLVNFDTSLVREPTQADDVKSKMESSKTSISPYWQGQKPDDVQVQSSGSSPAPQANRQLQQHSISSIPDTAEVSTPTCTSGSTTAKDKEKQMRAVVYQNFGNTRQNLIDDITVLVHEPSERKLVVLRNGDDGLGQVQHGVGGRREICDQQVSPEENDYYKNKNAASLTAPLTDEKNENEIDNENENDRVEAKEKQASSIAYQSIENQSLVDYASSLVQEPEGEAQKYVVPVPHWGSLAESETASATTLYPWVSQSSNASSTSAFILKEGESSCIKSNLQSWQTEFSMNDASVVTENPSSPASLTKPTLNTSARSASSTSEDDRIRAVVRHRVGAVSPTRSMVTASSTASVYASASTATLSSSFGAMDSQTSRKASSRSTPEGVPVGAISVFLNGLVIPQAPGSLAIHPSAAEAECPTLANNNDNHHQQQASSAISQPPQDEDVPATGFTNTLVEEKQEEGKVSKEIRSYKKYMLLLGAVGVLATLAAGIGVGVGVALSGGKKATNGTGVGGLAEKEPSSPTAVPAVVQEYWDPIRKELSRYYIVNEYPFLTSETDLDNSTSAQHQAWKWLVLEDEITPFVTSPASNTETDTSSMTPRDVHTMLSRYVLAVMYFELDGRRWTRQSNWLDFNGEHCFWEHIICDANGTITQIITGGRPGGDVIGGAIGMEGKLPSEIRYLTALDSLRVPGNLLHDVDALSEDLAVLSRVDLAGNPLQDIGPVFRLPSVITLSLQDCGLQGTLPSDIQRLTTLLDLSLSGNRFTGTLTDDFRTMTSLRNLVITNNFFDGDIMDIMSWVSGTLETFHFSRNFIKGSLNASVEDWKAIKSFVADQNSISGTIPPELGSLTTLAPRFSMAQNFGIQGHIPNELGYLTNLEFLDLSGTSLTGPIPTTFGNMTRLKEFNLLGTLVSGTVPDFVCNLESLTVIRAGWDLDCVACEKCTKE